MAPQMYLVGIRLTHRCGGDRCEEKAISREGCQAWVRQTATESDFNVWLAWSAMENLTERGAPIWAWENTPASGLWLCDECEADSSLFAKFLTSNEDLLQKRV